MSFNRNCLIELRCQKKISRYRLGLEANIDKDYITRLENGECKNPDFKTVENMSEFFGVPMELFNLYSDALQPVPAN